MIETDLRKYNIIGFDLDGTLYDEKDFIVQVYKKIAKYLINHFPKIMYSDLYTWLVDRWLEKGSSYPFIYSEALVRYTGESNPEIIENCLSIYRNFEPEITLHSKVKEILNLLLNKQIILFLVTDGNYPLQQKKFNALQLNKWFEIENVVYTGRLGKEYYKPNIKCLEFISCLTDREIPVLYFGDREIDQKFALNAKFDFGKVQSFYEFWEVK